ncbi:MAG: glycosyltransferase [Verrucomicrobiota bacterium]
MKDIPEISIVVPVRNRADLLRLTLEGLARQTLRLEKFEVIVCDDGSNEDLQPIVAAMEAEGLNIRYERQGPEGPATARNLGIRHARAPLVLLMDSDVQPEPEVVAAILSAMRANPEWVGAEARLRPIGDQDGPLWQAPASEAGGHYHTAAIAFPKHILEAVGGMDQNFKMAACEDAELAARVLKHGKIGFVPEALVLHPVRRVTWKHHLRWRKHWWYLTTMAVRYGFLAFPGKSAGPTPRLRVALCAVVTQPFGRFRRALMHLIQNPAEGLIALGHVCIDILAGLWALPEILFRPIPERKNWLTGAL